MQLTSRSSPVHTCTTRTVQTVRSSLKCKLRTNKMCMRNVNDKPAEVMFPTQFGLAWKSLVNALPKVSDQTQRSRLERTARHHPYGSCGRFLDTRHILHKEKLFHLKRLHSASTNCCSVRIASWADQDTLVGRPGEHAIENARNHQTDKCDTLFTNQVIP